MEVKLITYGDDALWKRKTVMLNGRQVGYVNDAPGSAVLGTAPLDDEEKAFVAAEVARIKDCEQGDVVVPVFIDADALDEDDDADELN